MRHRSKVFPATTILSASALRRARGRWKGSFFTFVAWLDRRNIPYLSPSKVSCPARCPRCYYRQYVLGEKQDSLALQVGALFHRAAKRFYVASSTGALPRTPELLGQIGARNLPKDAGETAKRVDPASRQSLGRL